MVIDVHLGYVGVIVFLFAMLLATIGVLGVLGVGAMKFLQKTIFPPERFLIVAIGLISMPIFFGIGNAISTFWGDTLFFISWVFIYVSFFLPKET